MRQENYERLQERSRREFGDRRNFRDESNQRDLNRPQNLMSGSRSDYDDNARGGEDRGWFDRASDEVSSWFGGDERDNRNQTRDARDRNINEYDGNSYHSNPAGYTPKEANPFYPTTNRIYERDDRSEQDDFSNRNFQSNQNRNFNQSRGFASMENQNNRQPQQNRWRDWHDTRAGDLMTRNVASVHPNETVQRAARLMRDEDCGALPVVDRQGRMIGMITDRDITVRLVADGADPRFAQVQDCMTDEVFACHANDPIEGCIRLMKQHQVRRMPVVNDRNQLLGIISQGDLVRHADMNKHQGERHALTDMIAGVSEPSNSAYR